MTAAALAPERRDVLRRRVRIVVAITITWNVIEAVVALSAVLAVREGVEAWKGRACCAAPVAVLTGDREAETCEDPCCAADVQATLRTPEGV